LIWAHFTVHNNVIKFGNHVLHKRSSGILYIQYNFHREEKFIIEIGIVQK